MPPDPPSIASPLAFGPLALKLHWQMLADIGRYFQKLSANWQTFFFFYMQPCLLDHINGRVLMSAFM